MWVFWWHTAALCAGCGGAVCAKVWPCATGVLKARSMTVAHGAVLTPLSEAFMLSTDDVVRCGARLVQHAHACLSILPSPLVLVCGFVAQLDLPTMRRIVMSTHSRVPIFYGTDRSQIAGILLVKWLITLDPDDATPISSLFPSIDTEGNVTEERDPAEAVRGAQQIVDASAAFRVCLC